ncbi:MAG: sigma-70 family RNA polymerase sigma factor [Gammaproteobacteria bacterium]|jgi:RNA polymerase sigma-70 factor (ECF subfamily)
MAERFQTTQWSIVLNAAAGGESGHAALTTLCETYRQPVLAYVRTRVRNADDAEDLTQAFFTHVLERQLPASADRERGRFRSFLLKSLNHFLTSEWQRDKAQRRGGHATMLRDGALESIASDNVGPEQAFEQEWARTVLREALRRLAEEARIAGREKMFAELRPYLVEAPEPGDYDRIAASAGMRGNTIAVAVHRLRSRLQELVEEVVADTAADAASIRDELRRMRDTMDSIDGRGS